MAISYHPSQWVGDGERTLPRVTVHEAKNMLAAITMNVRYLLALQGHLDANPIEVGESLHDIDECTQRLSAVLSGANPVNDR
jgi:hypothetical protein